MTPLATRSSQSLSHVPLPRIGARSTSGTKSRTYRAACWLCERTHTRGSHRCILGVHPQCMLLHYSMAAVRLPMCNGLQPHCRMCSDVMKTIEKKTSVPAAEQFAAVHDVWAAHVPCLKIIFRFFCMQGASYVSTLALCQIIVVMGGSWHQRRLVDTGCHPLLLL